MQLENNNGILFPKLFWPTLRKRCFSVREGLLKFKAEGQEFAKSLRSLEQFIQTVKGQYNFWNRILFQLVHGGFSDTYKTILIQIGKNNWDLDICRKS